MRPSESTGSYRLGILVLVLFFNTTVHAQNTLPRAEILTRFTYAYPALSHDGARVAYMANVDGDFGLCTVSPRTPIRAAH